MHDPDCLLLDKNHEGPHHVRPGHPKLNGPHWHDENCMCLPTDAQAEIWLVENDLIAVTHWHDDPTCWECHPHQCCPPHEDCRDECDGMCECC